MGKKYLDSVKTINSAELYDPAAAVALAKSTAKAKFDETIECHIRLGVDSRHADQQVRGAIVLPHGTGKKVRVLVFAKGDKHLMQVLTMQAAKNSLQKSRAKTGSSSTSL